MSKALRFAFVGCGGIARFHLRALQNSQHVTKVSAAVDVRKKNAEDFVQLLPNSQDCKVGGANKNMDIMIDYIESCAFHSLFRCSPL